MLCGSRSIRGDEIRFMVILLRPTAPRELNQWPRGAVYVLCQALRNASRRMEIACATAARVACVALSGLSIMKSCVMPS
jgi:hypothetical protein